ncbi:glycosyltransferase family protein [Lysinibacillus telephonicus]|uniref:glycosyltransferase family protein n=1 Tax=Lysinibacillus telephonicus TaxID=1714840 RepID=UPI003B9E752A
MTKFLLLKGNSQYNVLRYWTDALAVGFEKIGVEADVLDLRFVDDHIINKYLKNNYDAVIAFNGYLKENEAFSNFLNCPYIYLLIDHPIDHLGRIRNLRPGDILTLMDRNDVNNLYHFGYDFENTYLLPHAAIELSLEKEEKSIDILVSGTYSNYSQYMNFIEGQSPILFNICKEVIDSCLEDSSKYYIDEFLYSFEKRGLPIKLRINENPEIIKIVRVIGRYLYSINRLRVITALAEEGMTIDIFGNGWENSPLANYPNVRLHKPVNYWQTQKLMRQSKIVLSFQALLRDGTHERVFAGMAANSVVVTNETPYLKELFQSEKELIFYNFNDLGLMVQNVRNLLHDEQYREAISDAARQAIVGNHTFNQRAQQIVDIYNDVYNK